MRLEFDSVAVPPPPVSSDSFDDFGFPNGNGLDALLKKGVAAAQSGDRDAARKLLSRASAIDPNCEDAWMWLASISEYPEELLAFLDRVLSINGENARALEWRQATRSLLAKNFVQRAVAAREQENDSLAERCVDQALEFDADFAPAWFVRAAMANDNDQKLEFLHRVLELDPEHDAAKEGVAAVFAARAQAAFDGARHAAAEGEHDRAMEILDTYLEDVPGSVEAWTLKSQLSPRFEQKIEALEKALEIAPDNVATNDAVAAVYADRANAAFEEAKQAATEGSHEKAMEILDAYLVDVPESVEAWMLKADLSPDVDQKIEALEKALEIAPDNAVTKDAVAAVYAARSQAAFDEAKQAAMAGDQTKAIEVLDAYLNDVPDSVEAWTLKSHLSSSVEEKVEALEKALEIDPENAAARSGLAFLALTFGATKEAPASAAVTVETQAHDESSVDPYADLDETVSPNEDLATQVTEESVIFVDEVEFHQFSTDDENAEDPQVEAFSPRPEAAVEVDQPRSVDELFGPVHVSVDAENETVDSFSPFASKVFDDATADTLPEEMSGANEDFALHETFVPAEHQEAVATQRSGATCPFCGSLNEHQALDCGSCRARLTLSDIEALLTPREVNRDFLQAAVTQMEAEWNLREFNETEMTALGLGHLNLGNFDLGLKYLQEASRLDANNVILAGQVNSLAIRMDEISRQNELNESRLTGKTILVVDDSPTVRKLISGKLEKSGHVVICASDGVEALEQLEAGLPDLVLLDITMPRMDGYEVCKQIRSNPQAKDLPVVMISGKDGFFDKVRGRMAGSTGYVTKPFGPETLMKALETYLLPEA